MEVKDYLDLITSAFREKPKYTAMIADVVGVPVEVQKLLASMIPLFDLDTATGVALDIIGAWVGASRDVAIPITGVYFSWDADYTLGWEYGSWSPELGPTDLTVLPDDAFRTLIRAKIAANHWDGTTTGAYAIWSQIFPATTILIQDHQDMSYDMALIGGIIDSLTLALLTGGYLPLKPEAIRINTYYVSTTDDPVFGWDVEGGLWGGWDEGAWLREITP